MIRSEDDVRIAITFENVVMHPRVPCFAASIAALTIDNNLPGALAGCKIVVYSSSLQLERAVDRMKNVTQREFDAGLRRVQFEGGLLPKERRGCSQQDQNG